MGRVSRAIISLLPLGLGLFFPVLFLLATGFASLPKSELFGDSYFFSVIRLTYVQAAVSALLSGILGTAAALFYSENRFWGRALFWRVSLVCFSLPSVLVALAMLGFWGPRYGWFLVLAAHVFFNFPIFLQSCGTALERMDRTEEKVALSLGAGRWRCFWSITARKLWPLWRTSYVLAFLYCSSSLLIVLLLGGGPGFTTLEVAIYQAIRIDYDLALASRLAVLQLVVSIPIYLWLARRTRSPRFDKAQVFFPLYSPRSKTSVWALYALAVATSFAVFLGPLARFLFSGLLALSRGKLELGARPLLSSVALAVGVGFFSALYCFGLTRQDRASRRSTFSFFASLPLAVSPLLLLFSLSLAYPGLMTSWRGSLLPILLVQALASLPLVVRPLQAGFSGISDSVYGSARSLGADRRSILKWIEWPLVRPFLWLGFLYGAAFSLGEVGSVLLFLADGVETLPLEIFRSLQTYRLEQAEAMGVILFFMALLLQGVIARLAKWE